MFGAKREEDGALDEDRYFQKRLQRARLVCERFPDGIDFRDKDVLDIGSGFGALSTFAARQGARSVLGIDPDPDSVATANRMLALHAPEFRGSISFRNIGLERIEQGAFDLAVSMAVFEHVPDPHEALRQLSSRMRPGGKVFLGIGPLYRAPWGDHRRTRAPFQKVFPWSHLVFPENWLVARRNKLDPEEPVSSIRELGLNCLRLPDYRTACEQSGLHIDWWKTNMGENRLVTSLLNFGMAVPGLRDLLAVNLYVVLSKREDQAL